MAVLFDPQQTTAAPRATVILDFAPGEAAQVDFGAGPLIPDKRTGEVLKSWDFVMTLCHSWHQYAELIHHQNVESLGRSTSKTCPNADQNRTFPVHASASKAKAVASPIQAMKGYECRISVSCAAFFAVLLTGNVLAQELTPRAYWPAPKGTRVGTLGIAITDGDVVPDPSLPITGLDSSIRIYIAGYLHTIDLFGRTANVVFEVPYSEGTTVAAVPGMGSLEHTYRGLGDIAATLSVNLIGAPSMTAEDFAALRRDPHPILGASLRLVAPTGEYESDRVINVGANRWAARAELGRKTILRATINKQNF